jgi:uncharacterized phage-associated protein
MPFPATAIANELLDRAEESRAGLTQINIQKLVYFAHGWHLAWRGEPLILDSIEAWQYGPVVRNLYNQFKRFGSDKITDKAVEFLFDASGRAVMAPSCLDETPSGKYARNVVGAIWNQYGQLKPFQLVELTHVPGSPWEKAWKAKQALISNEDIQRYFSELRTTAT